MRLVVKEIRHTPTLEESVVFVTSDVLSEEERRLVFQTLSSPFYSLEAMLTLVEETK